MVKTVAIVGAGLGGLAAAIALRQQGIPVQVYEKARDLQPIGAGLSLFPNGLKALEAIAPGIVQSLEQLGSRVDRVSLKKSNGELVVQTHLTLLEKYQQPMLNIRWSDLQATLAAQLPTDVIHLDHQCLRFEQNPDHVILHFAQGTTTTAALLIGADGINSTIRRQLIQDGAPRYAGRMSWRAIVPRQVEWLSPHETTIMTGADGKVFSLLDVGSGFLFWSAGALVAEALRSENAEGVKSRVLDMFAGWSNPVEQVINATLSQAIIERPILDRPPLRGWSHNTVVLLGDAAHPMVPSLGQGANTAFEDAWELAQSLVQQPTLADAIAAYEQSRIYRTQVIQARSALQGSRSYDADSEMFLRGIAEQSQTNQADFEDWLYRYTPTTLQNG